jgi:hypothetical protein
MIVLLAACGGPDPTDTTPTAPDELAACAPENGPFTAGSVHPYLPFVVGSVHVVEGLEGGTEYGKFELTVLDETEDVAGVTTQVIEQRSYEEGDVLVEIARAYFAQAPDGTVCSFGEELEEIEDGDVVGEEGWLAREDGAEAGVYMPADPQVGQAFTMVFVPPDDIEGAEITALGDEVVTPAGTFTDTVTVLEDGPSLKHYARDIGQIYDDGMALSSY